MSIKLTVFESMEDVKNVVTENDALQAVLNTLPTTEYVINGHDEKRPYKLDDTIIYELANGEIGFGVKGYYYCINELHVTKSGKLRLSTSSIAGNICTYSRVPEDILAQVEYDSAHMIKSRQIKQVFMFA